MTGSRTTCSRLPGDPRAQDVVLLLGGRVAELDAQQEPVELGLGERVGALVLHRVGGGEHVEGAGSGKVRPSTVTCRSCIASSSAAWVLGGRAVDLVGEQQPGEQRTPPELEVARALVVDERAGQVGRQQVGGELRRG